MKTEMKSAILKVGQRVNCAFHWAGPGIIVAIHGDQKPASVGSMGGGCVVYGGSATFDVAYDNGLLSKMIPEAIIRGLGWTIYDEVVDADDVLDAVRHCSNFSAYKKEQAEATEARRANERKQHVIDNPDLIVEGSPQANGARGGKLAAINIRKVLKKEFPSIVFKVTSDYNRVNIGWTDGPTDKMVEKFTNRHADSYFDGMDDSTKQLPDATFAQVFGGCGFIFARRDESLAGVREAWKRSGFDPAEIPDDWNTGNYDHDWMCRVRRNYYEHDLTDVYAPPPKPAVEKAKGPFWSKRGLLAVDAGGWPREFRKEAKVAVAMVELMKAGFMVKMVHGRRRSCYFIQKVEVEQLRDESLDPATRLVEVVADEPAAEAFDISWL